MKVVLFCGGEGMRMRDYSDTIPKPMVTVGYRPILWHVMKYYAHFGHTEFILCLGYRGDAIKRYFLDYDEAVSNDFILRKGGAERIMIASDIDDWTITFVDTGASTPIGERLRRVRPYLEGDPAFLANYADGVTDLDLDGYVASFLGSEAVGSFLAVRPPQSYHVVTLDGEGAATSIGPMGGADLWLNGGYFAFRSEVFDYIEPGEDLVSEPFRRLIAEGRLRGYPYEGFWSAMDTFKDKRFLDELYEKEKAPWALWVPR